jgi:hypothetical protein
MAAAAVCLGAPALAHEPSETTRKIVFPRLSDGRHVVAVDLHTHSVFSDGMVWPTIRVEEAQKDGLAALAVTEHLEYQPKKADIPNADRNRAYELALAQARPRPLRERDPEKDLLVIPGAEVTRGMPPGHVNAVFIKDANKLIKTDARAAFEEANAQGAFVFWNHPYWTAQTPDGVARMTDMHRDLIKAGLLHGVEVANGQDLSPEALEIAFEYNLTVLGTSDVHGLVDWDYDIANGGHRTATLVLTKDLSADGMKAALKAGETVAIFKGSLVGRPQMVETVVKGSLSLSVGVPPAGIRMTPVTFRNTSPIDYVLELQGPESFYDAGRMITVPAHGEFTAQVRNAPDPAKVGLTFVVMNTQVGRDTALTVHYGAPSSGSGR